MRKDERECPELTDRELVRRGVTGDEVALGVLVRRHQAAAYRVALSLMRGDDVAQDIVQDSFLKAFRALDRFRGDASFRTWLLTIAANEARGALRRQARRNETAFEEAGVVRSEKMAPHETALVALEADRARSMMENLPEKQRLSLSLRIEEGLSFREIGRVIGSSEGAARANYFHAIRRLRELMK